MSATQTKLGLQLGCTCTEGVADAYQAISYAICCLQHNFNQALSMRQSLQACILALCPLQTGQVSRLLDLLSSKQGAWNTPPCINVLS